MAWGVLRSPSPPAGPVRGVGSVAGLSELPGATGCGEGRGLRPWGAGAGGSSGCPRPQPAVPGAAGSCARRAPQRSREARLLEVGSSSSKRGSQEACVWVGVEECSYWDCKMEVTWVLFEFISLFLSVFYGDTLLRAYGYKTEMSSFGFYSFTAFSFSVARSILSIELE